MQVQFSRMQGQFPMNHRPNCSIVRPVHFSLPFCHVRAPAMAHLKISQMTRFESNYCGYDGDKQEKSKKSSNPQINYLGEKKTAGPQDSSNRLQKHIPRYAHIPSTSSRPTSTSPSPAPYPRSLLI